MIPGLWRRMLWWLLAAGGRTRFRSGYSRRRYRVMLSMTRSWRRAAARGGRTGSFRRTSWCISRWRWRCSPMTTMKRSRRGWPGTLSSWGCWDARWGPPTSGGITRARERLGFEPLRDIFARVAVPVADQLTRGAFLGAWRLMSIDGFEWDAPDTPGNAAAFGYAGSGADRSAFPKVRVVTVGECASHAVVDAEIGGVAGKGTGEQSLARRLYRRLAEDWLLIADRNFYNWADWCTAADSGAALLWRVKSDLTLPVLELLPDGSYRSVLVSPAITGKARERAHRGRPAPARTWTRAEPGMSG